MNDQVKIVEVGLREGLQSLPMVIGTDSKIEIIKGLIDAGIEDIQIGSFVNPKKLPQMADTEELYRRLQPYVDKARFSGLVLNERGLERAVNCGMDRVDLSMSSSDTHSLRNVGMDLTTARKSMEKMIKRARSSNLYTRVGLQCVFGCAYEGEVSHKKVLGLVKWLLDMGVDAVSLADSAGMAYPTPLKHLLSEVFLFSGSKPVVIHLHDTRGLGLINLAAAFESGARIFDTSLGGLGGCPYIPGALGNLATEDVVDYFSHEKVSTGIDIVHLFNVVDRLRYHVDRDLPGRMYKIKEVVETNHGCYSYRKIAFKESWQHGIPG